MQAKIVDLTAAVRTQERAAAERMVDRWPRDDHGRYYREMVTPSMSVRDLERQVTVLEKR